MYLDIYFEYGLNNKIFINPALKNKPQQLRNQMPKAEIVLWNHLRNCQLKGYKFRRQYRIGKYVVDFYCPKLNLAVEVDGDSHFNPQSEKNDQFRQKLVESFNIKFLRITNLEIYQNLDGVIEKILTCLP